MLWAGGECAPCSRKLLTTSHSLALLARRLCSQYVDPQGLAPFLACHLIALDQNNGIRPIGIGETARRIEAKAILQFIRGDIQDKQALCV